MSISAVPRRAQTRSISRAAELNDITPSAASQHINELERLLGVTLLDRSTRPLSLTAEGKLYNELCRDVLRRNEEFPLRFERLKVGDRGRGSGGGDLLRRPVGNERTRSRSSCSGIRMRGSKSSICDRKRCTKRSRPIGSDLGLVSYPEPTREIAVLPWRDEEMVLTTAPDHPLARRDSIGPHGSRGRRLH